MKNRGRFRQRFFDKNIIYFTKTIHLIIKKKIPFIYNITYTSFIGILSYFNSKKNKKKK